MRSATVLVAGLLLAGCGGSDALPAMTDATTCEEAVEIVDEAISRAQAYLAGQTDDPARRDEIVFALSGAEERPECLAEETRQRATGLLLTLVSDS